MLLRTIACVLLIATAANAASKPNIVILLADDMGFSDIGCYGSEIATPNIDKLAGEGVRFTQFYNTSRCCPTRASLLTGLYPHQADMGWMAGHPTDIPGYRQELSHDAVTIAEALKPAGYATYMCGKWHVTSKENPDSPNDNWPRQRGFDRYYGTIKGGGSYFDPATLTRDNKPITPWSDPEYKPEHFYYTDAIGDQTCRFIREHHEAHADQPFFFYVAFTSPHWPLHAPAEVIARHKGVYDAGYDAIRNARFEKMKQLGIIDPSWQIGPLAGDWHAVKNKAWEARCMEVYSAQVDRMDQNVGKIIDTLRETKQLDNTLVLFLADNGGCAEPMGREAHADRTNAKPIKPRDRAKPQPNVFPRYTIDGRPIRDGEVIMPGTDDSFIAYGRDWANVSDTPFKEYKHFVHEGGISTPLIAHWPAKISRHGVLESQPGHLIDLMATAVDVAGASYPKEYRGHAITPMQGVSLLPAFDGKPLDRQSPIFFEHEGNRAVRDGQWKLVATSAAGAWELYDMQADRTEMHDLASKQPDRVKAMADAWQKWAEVSHVLPLQDFERSTTKPTR